MRQSECIVRFALCSIGFAFALVLLEAWGRSLGHWGRLAFGQQFPLPLDVLSLGINPLLLPEKNWWNDLSSEYKDWERFFSLSVSMNEAQGHFNTERLAGDAWIDFIKTQSWKCSLYKVLEGVSVCPLLCKRRSMPDCGEVSQPQPVLHAFVTARHFLLFGLHWKKRKKEKKKDNKSFVKVKSLPEKKINEMVAALWAGHTFSMSSFLDMVTHLFKRSLYRSSIFCCSSICLLRSQFA